MTTAMETYQDQFLHELKQDRVMATKMGCAAVEALMEGKTGRILVQRDNKVIDIDIEEGLKCHKTLDMALLEKCRKMSI